VGLSDAAARKIAMVLRNHVDLEPLDRVIHELLEIRGDNDFRDTTESPYTHSACYREFAERAGSKRHIRGLAADTGARRRSRIFFGKRAQSRKIVVTRRDSFPPLFELCVAAAPSAQKAADLQQSEPVSRYG
jgi:hypothetical protein